MPAKFIYEYRDQFGHDTAPKIKYPHGAQVFVAIDELKGSDEPYAAAEVKSVEELALWLRIIEDSHPEQNKFIVLVCEGEAPTSDRASRSSPLMSEPRDRLEGSSSLMSANRFGTFASSLDTIHEVPDSAYGSPGLLSGVPTHAQSLTIGLPVEPDEAAQAPRSVSYA